MYSKYYTHRSTTAADSCGGCKLPCLWEAECVSGLQMGRPRVQFACASALAMLLEGHPEACPLVHSKGGIAALASMLQQAGAQAKKAAAEALQVLLQDCCPLPC